MRVVVVVVAEAVAAAFVPAEASGFKAEMGRTYVGFVVIIIGILFSIRSTGGFSSNSGSSSSSISDSSSR